MEKKVDLCKDVIDRMHKIIEGGFVVMGEIGTRFYYYHTKKEARNKYLMEAKTNFIRSK